MIPHDIWKIDIRKVNREDLEKLHNKHQIKVYGKMNGVKLKSNWKRSEMINVLMKAKTFFNKHPSYRKHRVYIISGEGIFFWRDPQAVKYTRKYGLEDFSIEEIVVWGKKGNIYQFRNKRIQKVPNLKNGIDLI